MKSSQFITESLNNYLAEDLRNDLVMRGHIKKLDEGFFKPWVKHLDEGMQLTPDQVSKLFTSAQQNADAGGANNTGLGKIVDKIIPDALLAKLFQNLPEPDPKAAPDPQFQQKADAAIAQLPVDGPTKQGLAQVAAKAAGNPAAHAIILSLLGGVLGGVLNKVGPALSIMIPGGGTAVAGITGAVVAGTVAIAAAKLQGKGWKEAFKGAIKPALAGAAGAVLGSLAAQFAGAAIDHFSKPADAAETPMVPPDDTGPNQDPNMPPAPAEPKVHTVAKGETLSQLAKDAGTTVEELARLNPEITNVHKVPAGFELKMPAEQGTATNPYGGNPGLGANSTDAQSQNPFSNGGLDASGRANAATDPRTFANQDGGALPGASGPPGSYQRGAGINQTNDYRGANLQPAGNGDPSFGKGADYANPGGVTTTTDNYIKVGGERVIPGQALSPTQMAATQMSLSMGNNPDPGVLQQYLQQGGPSAATMASPAYKQAIMSAPDLGSKNGQVFENRKRYIDRDLTVRMWYLKESLGKPRGGVQLTNEGIGDMFKKAGQFIKTGVQNKLKSVTADKLNMAWGKAGNPMDSDLIYQIMQNAGVSKEILDKIFGEAGIPLPAGKPAEKPADAAAGGAPGAAGANPAAAGGAPGAPGAAGAPGANPAAGVGKADAMKAVDAMIEAMGAIKGKAKSAAIKYANEKLATVKIKVAEPAAPAGGAPAAPGGAPAAPRPTGPKAVPATA